MHIAVTNPDQNNTYTYSIRVTDTTQFNPRWSTYYPFDTQWGFTNTTTSNITGTLTVYDSTGVVLATITKTYPPGLFTLVSAKASGVPVNHFSDAIFAYTGPQGLFARCRPHQFHCHRHRAVTFRANTHTGSSRGGRQQEISPPLSSIASLRCPQQLRIRISHWN